MSYAGMLLSHDNTKETCGTHTKPQEHRYLHAAGSADAGMRNVAIPTNLIGGVNNHHAPVLHLRKQSRHLPNHCCLSHSWPALRKRPTPSRPHTGKLGQCYFLGVVCPGCLFCHKVLDKEVRIGSEAQESHRCTP